MICPNCGRTYREGIDYCNNCDTELIPDNEEEEIPSDFEDYSELCSAFSLIEVDFMKNVLDTEDIRYHFDADLYTSQINELIKPAVLMVHADDFDRAKELLQENNLLNE